MPTSYRVEIISYDKLLEKPQVISTINKIFHDSGWDDSQHFFTKLINYEYCRVPNYAVLFYKNNKAVGARTLSISKNMIILENGCIVMPSASLNFSKTISGVSVPLM